MSLLTLYLSLTKIQNILLESKTWESLPCPSLDIQSPMCPILISWILDLPFIGMSLLTMMIILMFYFILGKRTHCIWTWWFVLYIGRKPIVDDTYGYICWLCWALTLKHMIDEMFCVGHGPWSTWSMRCFLLSERLLRTWVLTFVLSIKLWNTWKYNWKCWA